MALAGCLWKPNPGVAPLAEAERPVAPLVQAGPGPELALRVLVRAGSAYDPPGREGLAWLSAHALTRSATPDQAAAEVAAVFERCGQAPEVTVGPELVSFRLDCPPEHAAEAARTLGALVSGARLEQGAFDEARAAATVALSRFPDAEADTVAAEVLRLWTYEAHPYGHLSQGRPGSLAAITPLDVSQFLARRYVRSVLAAGVEGPDGLPARDAARDALGESLSVAPPLLSAPRTPRLVPARTERAMVVLDREGDGLALALGQGLDLRWDEPDGLALAAAVAILDARLQEDLGALGTATARLEGNEQTLQGALRVTVLPATPEQAPAALLSTLRVVEQLARDGVEAAQLRGGTATPPSQDSLLAARLMRWASPDTISRLRAEPPAPATVNAAIARWIHPKQWSIVAVVHDPDQFVEALVEYPAPSSVQTTDAATGTGSDPGAAQPTRYKADIDRITVMNLTELLQ